MGLISALTGPCGALNGIQGGDLGAARRHRRRCGFGAADMPASLAGIPTTGTGRCRPATKYLIERQQLSLGKFQTEGHNILIVGR